MTLVRVLLAAAAVAFCVLLGLTIAGEGTAGMSAVTDSAWGRVTLADFYLGVACFVTVIGVVERSVLPTLGWGLALALLGYPVGVLWLLLRGLPRLRGAAGTEP
jgi:hypothetical protein